MRVTGEEKGGGSMSRAIRLLGIAVFLAACGAQAAEEPTPLLPTAPIATEPARVRGPAFIDSSELLMLESFPVQVRLRVTGTLPTPCHELLWNVIPPDEEGRIRVDLYTESDPDLACIQVLQEFDTSLALGSFAEGAFTVWLNGEQAGEFALP